MATSTIPMTNSSGSNTNGSYCKMGDGTLICWGGYAKNSVNANTNASIDVTFPISFYYAPNISVSPRAFSTDLFLVTYNDETTTGFVIRARNGYSQTSNLLGSWIAIGRWKA